MSTGTLLLSATAFAGCEACSLVATVCAVVIAACATAVWLVGGELCRICREDAAAAIPLVATLILLDVVTAFVLWRVAWGVLANG